MCTTDLRDEIIAEILVAHVRLPRRYAAWLVAQADADERSYLTKAALKNRRAHVAAKQQPPDASAARPTDSPDCSPFRSPSCLAI